MDRALSHTFDTLTDCFGIEYKVIRMPGSGFCLYHGLSYCLTGSHMQFEGIIEDCLAVFQNVPDLFRLRTNFGSYGDSSATVDDYASYMRYAIPQVAAGRSVDSHFYGDEGHLTAVSLLYDITIFTYSTVSKSWFVFNEDGRKGYICLLNLPDHFDVLQGTDGQAPAIPLAAHTVGANRRHYDTSADAWYGLQHNYSFQYVFDFPEQYSGVQILNNPVVPHSVTCTASSEAVGNSGNKQHVCDYEQCGFEAKNPQSLKMHKLRCHKGKSASRDTYVCDYEQCMYVAKSAKALNMHKLGRHHGKSAATKNVEFVCDFKHCEYISEDSRSLQTHKSKRQVVKQTSKAKKQHKDSRQLQTTANDVQSLTETSSVCVDQVATNSKDKTVIDAESVCSRDSNGSRRSERLARKRAFSFTDCQSGRHVSSTAHRLSDINDRGLRHETKTSFRTTRQKSDVIRCYTSSDIAVWRNIADIAVTVWT